MEFMLGILSLATLVWLGVLLARGGVLAGCGLVVLAGCCFGHPFFNLPLPGLPLTLDRALLVVVAGQALLYRAWGWRQPRPPGRADWLALAFLAVIAVSLSLHNWQFSNGAPLGQFLFFNAMPLVVYWLMRSAPLGPRQAAWLIGGAVLFGLYLAATALAEVKGGGAFVFPGYIASPQFAEFLGRARGPFLNPAANGIYLGTGACAALLAWPHVGRWSRLALVAGVLPLFAAGLYCTLTRSAWMGGLFGLAMVGLLAMPRTWRLPVGVGGLILTTVVLAASWESFVSYKRDRELDAEQTAESARLRPLLAAVAWQMFQDRPLFGCGYGQYLPESRDYFSDRTVDLPLEKARSYVQHNVWLSLLVETGLLGAGLWTLLCVHWATAAFRLWRDVAGPLVVRQLGLLQLAILACYVPNAMFQDCSIIPMVNMLLFFSAGAVQAAIAARSDSAVQSLSPADASVHPRLIAPSWPRLSSQLP